MTERRAPYAGQTTTPPLLVTDAVCHGQLGDRECGADLARYIERACAGEPCQSVVIRCPVCRNQVTISLSWQPALLCASPVLLAESVH
jgi:hypothetical protein